MSGEENTELNRLGRSILGENGFPVMEMINHDFIRSMEFEGYAHYYLFKCQNESKGINAADESIYRQLVLIDFKLGFDASQQLEACLTHTHRWDLIQV